MAKKDKDSKSGAPAMEIDATPHASAKTKARLREHYQKNVVPALVKDFNYKNVMAVPRIEKVSINIGMGEATGNQKLIDSARSGTRGNYRPEAGCYQGEQVDCGVQAS